MPGQNRLGERALHWRYGRGRLLALLVLMVAIALALLAFELFIRSVA